MAHHQQAGATRTWERQVADVLQIVLEHCQDASRLTTVCSLLQVNSACRAAIQRARGHLNISFPLRHVTTRSPRREIHDIVMFAAWLPKHAGLVEGLRVHSPPDEVATVPIGMALQLCATPAESTVFHGEEAMPLPLQLDWFATQCPASTALLLGLKVAGLRRLEAEFPSERAGPSLCAALAAMATLQSLDLRTGCDTAPRQLLEVLPCLSQLTRLEVCTTPDMGVLLPPTLQELDLVVVTGDRGPPLDLQHLSGITALELYVDLGGEDNEHAAGSVCKVVPPAHLHSLSVERGPLRMLSPCTIRKVTLDVSRRAELLLLEQLLGMQQPWELKLDIDTPQWDEEYRLALQGAAQALRGSSHLTALCLHFSTPEAAGAGWCSAAAALTGLQLLHITGEPPAKTDVLQLTGMSGLRSFNCWSCVFDDYLAVSVLSALVGLEDLHLDCQGLRSMAVLCAVSQLTGLTRLRMTHWNEDVAMCDYHLQHLQTLEKLQMLQLSPIQKCSAAAIEALHVALAQLTSVCTDDL